MGLCARIALVVVCLSAPLLAGCGSRAIEKYVVIEVDGKQIQRQTHAETIADVLLEAHITLGPLDRVSPDLVEPAERAVRIVVTRVKEQTLVETRVLPYGRTVLRDEALPDGTSRVIQLGVNGREQLQYRVVVENGVEAVRDLISQTAVEFPREEIVLVGAKGQGKTLPLSGTVYYLSNANAWVMRDLSSAKRPLTFSGDLDGRVFALSPDGTRLLFSRRASVGGAAGAVGPLNSLWQVDTRIVGEPSSALGVENVLYADWLSATQIIYTSGERTPGAPGWKAHNDLWSYEVVSRTRRALLQPMSPLSYAFWGARWALAPDRRRIVYATAEEIGFVDVSSGVRITLQQFPAYPTNAGWVWTPDLAWSPDSALLAATLHTPPPGTANPERAPLFDVWAINASGAFAAQVAPATGMLANPAWSAAGRIAYGQAHNPEQSADSQYDIYLMDVDGSNKVRVFPSVGDRGVTNPQLAWSPDGRWLMILQDGNLHMVDAVERTVSQMTNDGGTTLVLWR